MPNRIWSDEKNDWIVVDDAVNQAINVEVLDGALRVLAFSIKCNRVLFTIITI